MNVLIVEDSPTLSKTMALMVRELGHNAIIARTGQEAMEQISTNAINLLFIDNFLPDGEGHDLIPRMKLMAPNMGVVAITGENTEEREQRTRSYGITYYMIKPIDRPAVKALINHAAVKDR